MGRQDSGGGKKDVQLCWTGLSGITHKLPQHSAELDSNSLLTYLKSTTNFCLFAIHEKGTDKCECNLEPMYYFIVGDNGRHINLCPNITHLVLVTG